MEILLKQIVVALTALVTLLSGIVSAPQGIYTLKQKQQISSQVSGVLGAVTDTSGFNFPTSTYSFSDNDIINSGDFNKILDYIGSRTSTSTPSISYLLRNDSSTDPGHTHQSASVSGTIAVAKGGLNTSTIPSIGRMLISDGTTYQFTTALPNCVGATSTLEYTSSTRTWSCSSGTFVDTTSDQTINGIKTFGSIPVLPASNPTSSNQAVRKQYVDDTHGTVFIDAAKCVHNTTQATTVQGDALVTVDMSGSATTFVSCVTTFPAGLTIVSSSRAFYQRESTANLAWIFYTSRLRLSGVPTSTILDDSGASATSSIGGSDGFIASLTVPTSSFDGNGTGSSTDMFGIQFTRQGDLAVDTSTTTLKFVGIEIVFR